MLQAAAAAGAKDLDGDWMTQDDVFVEDLKKGNGAQEGQEAKASCHLLLTSAKPKDLTTLLKTRQLSDVSNQVEGKKIFLSFFVMEYKFHSALTDLWRHE